MALTAAEETELLELLELEETYQSGRKLYTYFPETGPLRRELYDKHLDFFQAGRTHHERMLLAANRVGKTEGGLCELSYHLLGEYPAWWDGRRFEEPIRAWAAGDTNQTVREIIQEKLLGPLTDLGTGVLPRDAIHSYSMRPGLPGAIELVRVARPAGGFSTLVLKSYDQRRKAFQGTEQHVILLDEEPPGDVYTECLLRTMATTQFSGGIIMLTFTPLQGLSDVVLQYLPDGLLPEGSQADSAKYVVNANWDDVPHLSDEEKARLLASIPAWQQDARSRGLPVLGAGIIYPVPEDDYLVDDFELPTHYRRAYALDVGWNRTAALFGAYDDDNDTWYLYREYYRGQAEPSVHATGIKAGGAWIPGVIDPGARARSPTDGSQLMIDYQELGLTLTAANNAVTAGLQQVWERLSTGRLKVFRSLTNWRKEVRLYHRDEKGNIVKVDDHLMDDTRYLIMSGRDVAKPVPPTDDEGVLFPGQRLVTQAGLGWMR